MTQLEAYVHSYNVKPESQLQASNIQPSTRHANFNIGLVTVIHYCTKPILCIKSTPRKHMVFAVTVAMILR